MTILPTKESQPPTVKPKSTEKRNSKIEFNNRHSTDKIPAVQTNLDSFYKDVACNPFINEIANSVPQID